MIIIPDPSRPFHQKPLHECGFLVTSLIIINFLGFKSHSVPHTPKSLLRNPAHLGPQRVLQADVRHERVHQLTIHCLRGSA